MIVAFLQGREKKTVAVATILDYLGGLLSSDT
jgi:hypothetical protein